MLKNKMFTQIFYSPDSDNCLSFRGLSLVVVLFLQLSLFLPADCPVSQNTYLCYSKNQCDPFCTTVDALHAKQRKQWLTKMHNRPKTYGMILLSLSMLLF